MNNIENNTITYNEDYESEILIRLSVLTKGPLLERRKQIRKSFVIAALSKYQPNMEFDIVELSTEIKNITKCGIDDEDIIFILCLYR